MKNLIVVFISGVSSQVGGVARLRTPLKSPISNRGGALAALLIFTHVLCCVAAVGCFHEMASNALKMLTKMSMCGIIGHALAWPAWRRQDEQRMVKPRRAARRGRVW